MKTRASTDIVYNKDSDEDEDIDGELEGNGKDKENENRIEDNNNSVYYFKNCLTKCIHLPMSNVSHISVCNVPHTVYY